MKEEEIELIGRLKLGDKNAFLEVVEQYKNKIMYLCYSYTKDYGHAEDLSQEVFISFYKGVKKFRGDSSLSSYLYKITLNKCFTYKRKKSIKEIFDGLLNVHKQDTIDIDEKNYVRECINSLSEELKTPIVLYYYIGLSYKEISEIMNLTERAVEGRIYRAKQKLKCQIEKEEVIAWRKNMII